MSNKQLNIGLFGFGVVGEGIYKVLNQTPSLQANIQRICIKNADKKRDAPASLFTIDAAELLTDKRINVVVELIDDADAAYTIVKQALQSGKAVVSANKKMIANNLAELLELQKTYNVPFLYEAAVCGSIPVIRNLEEYYDNDLLHSFSGIVNGSTNYILSKMNEEGLAYETALTQAQDLGFAESNPSLDVEGIDAVNKLTIVLQHAFGITANPNDILQLGITHLHAADTAYAREKGLKIKLVAQAKRISDAEVAAFVLPTFVPASSQLYNVHNEFNGVLIGSTLADEQFLYGKGAGRYPTSSAVLSDIAALRYDYRYEYKKAKNSTDYALNTDLLLRIYVSYTGDNKLIACNFRDIEESYQSANRGYLTGTITLQTLKNAAWLYHENVSVIALGIVEEVKIKKGPKSVVLELLEN